MDIPSKGKIMLFWIDWLTENGFDIGEPSCWACGRWWGEKYDIKHSDTPIEEIMKNWDQTPLQRCHIIPKSLGGSDDEANLFLMCSECHDLAPDTTSVENFMKWVGKQDWYDRKLDKCKKELENFDLNNDEILELSNLLENMEDKTPLFNKIGIHFNQNGKGGEVKFSSFISALIDVQKETK